jgi:transposase InsO family protein
VKSPTTTAKIERFHKSLRREFIADRSFESFDAAHRVLDAWIHDYNTERPHQVGEIGRWEKQVSSNSRTRT